MALPEWRPGEEREFEIAPGVKIVMCWIPPGEFLMGSPEDEVGREAHHYHFIETQHLVRITLGFWLGKYPVTQAQWEAVMGSNPSCFKGYNLPVETVSWDDISEPGGFMERINHFSAAREIFSLPTEAQWEYACRAGTITALNNGKNLTSIHGVCPNLDEVAWYDENSGGKTHPVGQKGANGWGLHDMHGNVWEWCVDRWHEKYTDEPQVNPRGPITGTDRVMRGGNWDDSATFCRAADRTHSCAPSGRGNELGFRIARTGSKCDDVDACVRDDGKLHPLPKPTVMIVP
jgi:formylglycine-generating enzyme required for sulfatase activity